MARHPRRSLKCIPLCSLRHHRLPRSEEGPSLRKGQMKGHVMTQEMKGMPSKGEFPVIKGGYTPQPARDQAPPPSKDTIQPSPPGKATSFL